MATGDKKVLRFYGPWRGLNEWPGECGPGEFEDLWNIDCVGDVLTLRRGREKSVSTVFSFPASVIKKAGDAVTDRTDATSAVTDGNSATGMTVGAASQRFYLGFPFPVSNIGITLSVVNTLASTLAVKYFSATQGFVTVSGLADQTAVAGKTLAQNGTVQWSIDSDWFPTGDPSQVSGGSGIVARSRFQTRLYWLELSTSAGATATISEIKVNQTIEIASRTGIGTPNGLYHWRRRTGERLLIVGMDDTTINGLARLYVLDRWQGIYKPIRITADAAKSGPDAFWSFATFGDSLVMANGYTLLYTSPSDPFYARPFEVVPLKDSATRTNQPPKAAKYIAVYEDSIYAVEDKAPNTVRFSAPFNDVWDLKANAEAPLNGAHIWDPTDSFECLDPGGGPITGIVPVGHKLLIFTPRSTYTWTGDAVSMSDSDVGCVAPRSIDLVNETPFFLGPSGIYAHTGGANRLISKRVEPTIRSINRFAMRNAIGVVYRRRNQYRLFVPLGQDERNNAVIVYDYERDNFTKYGLPTFVPSGGAYQDYFVKLAHSARDEEWDEILYTVDYDGVLWIEDTGWLDGTRQIFGLAVGDRIKFEDQGVVTCRYVRVQAKTRGAGTGLRVAIVRDGQAWKKVTSGLFSGGEKSVTLSELDPVASQTRQFYSIGAGLGARLETDPWVSKRFSQRRASFGLSARNFQVIMSVGQQDPQGGVIGKTTEIRGFDFEGMQKERRGDG